MSQVLMILVFFYMWEDTRNQSFLLKSIIHMYFKYLGFYPVFPLSWIPLKLHHQGSCPSWWLYGRNISVSWNGRWHSFSAHSPGITVIVKLPLSSLAELFRLWELWDSDYIKDIWENQTEMWVVTYLVYNFL